MPNKQQQPQSPTTTTTTTTITKRRMTVDALWQHLENNVMYKKFYYEAFLTLQETSDAELEFLSHPFFDLCCQKLQRRDMEQLLCDIVMYRCDTNTSTTTNTTATNHHHSSSSSSKKSENSRSKSGTCGKDPDDGDDNDRVESNRHRPWYQGYSTGFVDVCSQLLQLMMKGNPNQNIIVGYDASPQRSTMLALHEHFQKLEGFLQAVLKFTDEATATTSGTIATSTTSANAIATDSGKDQDDDSSSSLGAAKIALLYDLLQPLELSFLTPKAYQEIHSILVRYDATKHVDVVLLGYCHGVIAACTYILKWTSMVAVQKNNNNATNKKKKSSSNKANLDDSSPIASQKTHHHHHAHGDSNKNLLNLSALASKMEAVDTTTTNEVKTTTTPTTTNVGSNPPSSGAHPYLSFIEPTTRVMDAGIPRTPYNTPRRVSFLGVEEKNSSCHSKQASSSSVMMVPSSARLQFTTGRTPNILSKLDLPAATTRKATSTATSTTQMTRRTSGGTTTTSTTTTQSTRPGSDSGGSTTTSNKQKIPSVLYSKMVFPTRARAISTTTSTTTTTSNTPTPTTLRRSGRIIFRKLKEVLPIN